MSKRRMRLPVPIATSLGVFVMAFEGMDVGRGWYSAYIWSRPHCSTKPWESWWILGKSYTFMAVLFRSVKYDNSLFHFHISGLWPPYSRHLSLGYGCVVDSTLRAWNMIIYPVMLQEKMIERYWKKWTTMKDERSIDSEHPKNHKTQCLFSWQKRSTVSCHSGAANVWDILHVLSSLTLTHNDTYPTYVWISPKDILCRQIINNCRHAMLIPDHFYNTWWSMLPNVEIYTDMVSPFAT